jgi:molybdopterin converting factor small subunit
MRIKFKLYRGYYQYVNNEKINQDGTLDIDLVDRTNLRSMITGLGIPGTEVKIILVNSRPQTMDYILQDGDYITAFPPIAGG